jgi:hypothetical protein
MNLHGTVRGAITSVNPDVLAPFLSSTGNTVDGAGNQTPSYAAAVNIPIQVQALSGSDKKAVNYLNLQTVLRSVYFYGNKQGVERVVQKGGDLVQFREVPNPQTDANPVRNWLVVKVLETWPDWSKAVVSMQQ